MLTVHPVPCPCRQHGSGRYCVALENRSLQSWSSLASARRVSSAGTGLAPVPQAKSLHGPRLGRPDAGGCGLLPARRVVVSSVHSHLNS